MKTQPIDPDLFASILGTSEPMTPERVDRILDPGSDETPDDRRIGLHHLGRIAKASIVLTADDPFMADTNEDTLETEYTCVVCSGQVRSEGGHTGDCAWVRLKLTIDGEPV